MEALPGHRAEGESEKKWLLVRSLVARPRIKKQTIRKITQTLQDSNTRDIYWNRLDEVIGNKGLSAGAKIYFYIRKRQTLVATQEYNNLYSYSAVLWLLKT